MSPELVGRGGFDANGATLYVHADWVLQADGVVREALDRAALDPRTFDLDCFVLRAFRRPPTAEEVARYRRGLDARVDAGESPGAALRATLFEVLASPSFRLRAEDTGAAPAPGATRPVSDFGLASRLSFMLWSAPPDDRLLDLAAAGSLGDDRTLAAEVERMLRHPRALDFARSFAGEWLGTRRLGRELKPDPIDNPSMTDGVMAAMRDEVARFYGLDGEVEGTTRVELRDPRRGGLLGKAAVLACTSYPDRTSPVLRGAWILEDLLGTPPPPPPPGASDISEEVLEEAEEAGPRELLELHRAAPACATCHDRIDPLGVSLEGFDRFGRSRRRYEEGARVNDRGQLPSGVRFRGPVGLAKALLAERRGDLARETSRRLLAYSLGRSLTWRDERTVDELAAVLDGEGFGALVHAIVRSRPFRFIDGSPPR